MNTLQEAFEKNGIQGNLIQLNQNLFHIYTIIMIS